MTFRVGQKVVCVDDEAFAPHSTTYPRAGRIYTIRSLPLTAVGLVGVRLVEVVNPPYRYRGGPSEPCYRLNRFRPIVERKTDISIFKKMLTPQGVDA